MLLGTVFQSVESWRKLSGVNMKPAVAYKILKYTKLVSEEHAIAEKQRVALLREITNTTEGQDAKIEPNTQEFLEYVERLNDIMSQESTLAKIDIDLDAVVNALDGKDDVLSVTDLAMLEPFFDTDDCVADEVQPHCDCCDAEEA